MKIKKANNTKVISNLDMGYTQIWQSPVFNNSEFDYRIYVQLIDMEQACGEKGFGINVSVSKTKKYISKDKLKSIAQTSGISTKEVSDYDVNDYGLSANIDGCKELIMDKDKAIETAKEFVNKFDQYTMLIGFYLDKYQNRIGNTGWDFLDGSIG